MISSSAYLLVFHGSRDRQAQSAAWKLANLLKTQFQTKNILTQHNYLQNKNINFEPEKIQATAHSERPLVDVAALELGEFSLSESLVEFSLTAVQRGYQKIKVIPLFLAPGVHVREDIPSEIALAIKKINNQITIELSPYLGKYLAMTTFLSQRFATMSGQIRILVAHGSRLPQVTEFYQDLASRSEAKLAYWSTTPSLAQQVQQQIHLGHQKIAVLPYFLFPGKIATAIATEVAQLQQTYPQVELILGEPLGATAALAELIFEAV